MIGYLLCILFIHPVLQIDPDPERFRGQIETFIEKDKQNPPEPGAILFVGSSSIVMWKSLKEDFGDHHVLNRGFGGSHASDVLYYFDVVVKPYYPSKILFYEGDNDLASGKSPRETMKDFKMFHSRVNKAFPDTEIGFIAAKPSPKRWDMKDKFRKFNQLLEKYCKKHKDLTFIDVFDAMLNERGRPSPEFYVSDSLHMSDKGYDIWQKQVEPFIEE